MCLASAAGQRRKAFIVIIVIVVIVDMQDLIVITQRLSFEVSALGCTGCTFSVLSLVSVGLLQCPVGIVVVVIVAIGASLVPAILGRLKTE